MAGDFGGYRSPGPGDDWQSDGALIVWCCSPVPVEEVRLCRFRKEGSIDVLMAAPVVLFGR